MNKDILEIDEETEAKLRTCADIMVDMMKDASREYINLFIERKYLEEDIRMRMERSRVLNQKILYYNQQLEENDTTLEWNRKMKKNIEERMEENAINK